LRAETTAHHPEDLTEIGGGGGLSRPLLNFSERRLFDLA
jgi:hypothetical protein